MDIFPLDDSDYLLALSDSKSSRVYRYSVRGKLRSEFGGKSGVELNGKIRSAVRASADNSVFMAASVPGQTPSTSLIRLSADGVLDDAVAPTSWASGFGTRLDAVLTGLGERGGSIYALVSQRTVVGLVSSPIESRIVALDKLGVPHAASGVTVTDAVSGELGDPMNVVGQITVTKAGVVLLRASRRPNRHAEIRVSRWPLWLGPDPISSIASNRPRSTPPRRPFFGASSLPVSRDGRFLYACGDRVVGLERKRKFEISRGVLVRRVRL